MYKIRYRLKISETVKARCAKHPKYNPETDGRAGIKGRCSTCFTIYDLHQSKIRLDQAVYDFMKHITPWLVYPKKRHSGDLTSSEVGIPNTDSLNQAIDN
jgi:hypothetical protein